MTSSSSSSSILVSTLQQLPPTTLAGLVLGTVVVAVLAVLLYRPLTSPAARALTHYGFPTPPKSLAAWSDWWLARAAGQGHRAEKVHEAHKQLGTYVRIAPDHLSIADPAAIPIIYGHGTGFLKTNYYDAFVSLHRGLFNTRDRADHTRKRKLVSNVFSQKNVTGFEPHIHAAIKKLVGRWDGFVEQAKKGGTKDGKATFDLLHWTNLLAFDIIGDLAFGKPFGMLDSGEDLAPVQVQGSNKTEYLPAIQILNRRGEYSATLGVVPPFLRPFAKRLPFFKRGLAAVQRLAGIAIAAVNERLANPVERDDLLSKLQAGKDDQGNPMGKEELTAEALTQLIAGSDTTSNSSCAILYHLSHNRPAWRKLQSQLDDIAQGKGDFEHFEYDEVKDIEYLQACIDEGLRLHSTSAIGLPREVPEGGYEVLGRFYPGGTVLSVPSFTIHRLPEVWGKDSDAYRPERWTEAAPEVRERMKGAFVPFSFGPRSCVGRNLASMELLLIISTIVAKYEIEPVDPDAPLETAEGFLRKPLGYEIKLSKRM